MSLKPEETFGAYFRFLINRHEDNSLLETTSFGGKLKLSGSKEGKQATQG